MLLSDRVQTLSDSITIAISTIAKKMKAEGQDVISLSIGEPDFDTPEKIKQAVINGLKSSSCSRYTPITGIKEVLEAIQTKLKRDNNLDYKLDEIITNVGAKHSLFNVFQAIISKDEEVIIPSPYWVTYPEIVTYSSGKPIFIETTQENDFKITIKQLKNAITSKTKAIILNSPSNPCGCIYTKEEFTKIAKVLEGTNILVISDEIYEKIDYDNSFCSFASVSKDAFKRTVTINGLSKSGAMTGWRFGYLACPIKELIVAIRKLQSQSTSNITSLVQVGAIPALLGECDDDIENMRLSFKERRDVAYKLVESIKGLSVSKPHGSFYLFINCKDIEKDSVVFCKKLLEEQKVAVVPGAGFGMDGYFRLSYATSMENIEEGLKRISNFVKNYKS